MTKDHIIEEEVAGGYTRRLTRSFAYFGTVLFSQLLSFFVLPFITRALPPEVYGTYSLALAISSLVSMVATSWMRNVALTIYFDRDENGTTRGFFLGVAVLQASGFGLLYLLTLAAMLPLGRSPEDFRVMISAGFMVLAGDLAVLATTLLRAERRAIAFGVAEAGGAVLRFGLTVVGLLVGLRTAELLFNAATLGYAIAAIVAIWSLWPRLKGPRSIDRSGIVEVVRHGPGALPFSIADWMERLADRVVIEGFLGTAAVGIYSLGYTVGERTIGALTKAVFMMAWPNILESYKKSGVSATALAIREAQSMYAWFGLGPAVFLVAYGPVLLEWFAGESYAFAGSIVPVVAVSMWLGGLSTYWNRHMEIRKQFGKLSAIRLVGAGVNVVLNLILVPRFGIIGAAWATMGNRALNAVVFFVTRDRELVEFPVASLAQAALLSAALWIATYLLPIALVWKCAIFIGIYGLTAVLALWRGPRRSRR